MHPTGCTDHGTFPKCVPGAIHRWPQEQTCLCPAHHASMKFATFGSHDATLAGLQSGSGKPAAHVSKPAPPSSVRSTFTSKKERAEKLLLVPADSAVAHPRALSSAYRLPAPSCLQWV